MNDGGHSGLHWCHRLPRLCAILAGFRSDNRRLSAARRGLRSGAGSDARCPRWGGHADDERTRTPPLSQRDEPRPILTVRTLCKLVLAEDDQKALKDGNVLLEFIDTAVRSRLTPISQVNDPPVALRARCAHSFSCSSDCLHHDCLQCRS